MSFSVASRRGGLRPSFIYHPSTYCLFLDCQASYLYYSSQRCYSIFMIYGILFMYHLALVIFCVCSIGTKATSLPSRHTLMHLINSYALRRRPLPWHQPRGSGSKNQIMASSFFPFSSMKLRQFQIVGDSLLCSSVCQTLFDINIT